ncbi:MAG: hypothetical protein ACYTE1_06425 [Planctomycetota bacterium]
MRDAFGNTAGCVGDCGSEGTSLVPAGALFFRTKVEPLRYDT